MPLRTEIGKFLFCVHGSLLSLFQSALVGSVGDAHRLLMVRLKPDCVWNLLGDGRHTVWAYADGEAFAHSTVTVTTLDGEFAAGLRRRHEIRDFPEAGQTTTVVWQESQ